MCNLQLKGWNIHGPLGLKQQKRVKPKHAGENENNCQNPNLSRLTNKESQGPQKRDWLWFAIPGIASHKYFQKAYSVSQLARVQSPNGPEYATGMRWKWNGPASPRVWPKARRPLPDQNGSMSICFLVSIVGVWGESVVSNKIEASCKYNAVKERRGRTW